MPGRLIVLSGLPGVGKSVVASLVAARLRAVHLSIDSVEEAMLATGLPPGWTTGVAAYEAVRAAAESNLTLGRTVVVDAVNDSEPARETWLRAAASTVADVHWILLCSSDLEEHSRRLDGRDRGFSFVAEPSWDDVRERAESYPPWPRPHLRIDSVDRAERIVHVPPARVFAALIDRDALETWLPPSGMSGHFEHFDSRPGGSYRLVLTYGDAATDHGKTTQTPTSPMCDSGRSVPPRDWSRTSTSSVTNRRLPER